MLTPLNGVLFMEAPPVTTFVVLAIIGLIPTHMQIAGLHDGHRADSQQPLFAPLDSARGCGFGAPSR
jgi:hypothetical protein